MKLYFRFIWTFTLEYIRACQKDTPAMIDVVIIGRKKREALQRQIQEAILEEFGAPKPPKGKSN